MARNFGVHKALVVTDPGVIAAGWTSQATASLDESGIPYSIFSQVTLNPRAEEVMTGADLDRRTNCNGILVVGGGSSIDCAKGIGIVSSNEKHILEFVGVDEVPIPGPPLTCVPTTAGSAADVSQFAVITERQHRNKTDIVSKALVPDVALIDRLTTTTMPSFLTACTGLDALSHAVEAFVSNSRSPVTDLHALEAIRIITQSLPGLFIDPANVELREKQMLGSLEAGLAFSNAGLGVAHAMAHSLGGFLDLARAECIAMVLVPVIGFNFEAAPDRYRWIGEATGLDLRGMPVDGQRSALLGKVSRLRNLAGLDRTLGQPGVVSADIPELATKAMGDACIVTNPRRPSPLDYRGPLCSSPLTLRTVGTLFANESAVTASVPIGRATVPSSSGASPTWSGSGRCWTRATMPSSSSRFNLDA